MIADLDLLRGNFSLLRNRNPQYGIFLSARRSPQHAKRAGQHCIRHYHWIFCGQTRQPMAMDLDTMCAGCSWRRSDVFLTSDEQGRPSHWDLSRKCCMFYFATTVPV